MINVDLMWTYLALGLGSHPGTSRALGVISKGGLTVGVAGAEPGGAAARALSLCCLSYSTNSFLEAKTRYKQISD